MQQCVSGNGRVEGLSNRATLEIMIDIKGNSFGCCLSLSKKSSKGWAFSTGLALLKRAVLAKHIINQKRG